MEVKRRLGGPKGGSNLAFNDELEVDELEPDMFAACSEPVKPVNNVRTSIAVNRRRSSMGIVGGGSRRVSLSEGEQLRIVEMYKTVIQMNSENVKKFIHSYPYLD